MIETFIFFYKLFILKRDYFNLKFFLRLEYHLRVILSVKFCDGDLYLRKINFANEDYKKKKRRVICYFDVSCF